MIKKTLLMVAAAMPCNRLRILCYRLFFGYRISFDSRIGWGNFLDSARCEIDRGYIGHFNIIRCHTLIMAPGSRIDRMNHIKHAYRVDLAPQAVIGTRNHLVGTRPGLTPFKEHENISVGNGSIITVEHLFDLSDTISIGDNVTFGGRGSEIWTHGFDLNHVKIQAPVEIGNDVYIGSRVIIIQGVKISDGVSIGAGTVVSKSIAEPGFYISSQLIKKGQPPDYSENSNMVVHNKARFVRK